MIFIIIMAITYLMGIGATWQLTDSDWDTPGPMLRAMTWPLMLPVLIGNKSGYLLSGTVRQEHKDIRAAQVQAEVAQIQADAAVSAARETEALRLRYETLGLDTSGFGDVNPKVRAQILSEIKN